jgi:serine-type D-Ala-D-Ala carboxypeptidase (penicillin-binding protein 5/6)
MSRLAKTGLSGWLKGLAMLVLVLTGPATATTIDTTARQAILIDLSSGTTLYEKNADERMPTSSMSKVMSMYMVFERLRSGRLSLDDTLPVSERAWRMQGSKMWAELNNNIKVEDLIRGVIIQSGNDACIVLAEGLSGTEEAFSAAMTKRAHELGMPASNFMNASGWPDPNHYSTARDLATLARRLIGEFPEYLHYYGEKEFTYHGIKQGNRNPLLYRNMGVDGLKTGHTDSAGYGLIATGERNGRRLVLVVNGLPSMQARADESARLLEWGWREFDNYALLAPGAAVDQFKVWLGQQPTVPVVLEGGLKLTLNASQRAGLKVTVTGQAPLPTPVVKGSRIGTLRVEGPDFDTVELPLVAGADVAPLGLFGRMAAGAGNLLFGAE